MKKILLLNLLIITLFQLGSSQNIINVNNVSTGVTTDYTTLQAAVTAANDGDIIYLYPSGTTYGTATIDKKLTIIGPGYWVQQNPNLGIETYSANGVLNNIYLVAGADGSYITGCDFSYMTMDGVSNIVISRNRISIRIYMKNTSNVIIEGCYFDWGSAASVYKTDVNRNVNHISAKNNNGSLVVRNNVFYAYFSYSYYGNEYYTDNIEIGTTSNAIIENNVFRDRCTFNNSLVRNNIFLMTDQYSSGYDDPIGYNASSCTFSNNILVKNQTGFDSTNVVNVDINTLFEGYPEQGDRSFDDRFMLKAGSPASGAGIGGIDCGPFDGVSPYKLSGLPFIPVVYQIIGPSQGTASEGIDVTVKVRSER